MVMFSVIVPVYNVENYLRACAESILSQSYPHYELIFVNDGSTDQSGVICDELASSDERISVIHKVNGGLSDARNAGLATAKGEYIVFVDSDDTVEKEALEHFYQKITEDQYPDVLISSIKKVFEDAETKYMDQDLPVDLIAQGNKNDMIRWFFQHSNSLWPSWRYIVRRDFIVKHHLTFAFGYLHEDVDWTARLFLYAESFSCSTYYWYNHRMGRQGSITTSKNAKRIADLIFLTDKNINDPHYSTLDEDIRMIIFRRLVYTLYRSLRYYKNANREEKKMIEGLLERNDQVLGYSDKLAHKCFFYVSKWFGFRMGLHMMGVLHR